MCKLSQNYLKTLSIDCVKIDKGFTDTMLRSDKGSKKLPRFLDSPFSSVCLVIN